MKPYHLVKKVSVKDGALNLVIDGKPYYFELNQISSSLAAASSEELKTFEVSPAGYGIHWPLLDEDLSIDGLLGILHSPGSEKKTA